MKKLIAHTFVFASLLVVGCNKGESAPDGTSASKGGAFAATAEVLNTNCVKCHGQPPKGGVDLRSYAAIIKGGMKGPLVTPGDPEKSQLIAALRGKGARQMPPSGPLAEEQIKVVEDWVKSGAKE